MGPNVETVSLEEYFQRYGAEIPAAPPVPEAGEHILFWFRELSTRRQPGFDSPAPLSYSEIEAWSRLTATGIRPEEVKILLQVDEAYLDELAKVRELARKEKDPKP